MAALYTVLRDNSGVYISPVLFPSAGAVAATANQIHSAKAGLSGRTAVKA